MNGLERPWNDDAIALSRASSAFEGGYASLHLSCVEETCGVG